MRVFSANSISALTASRRGTTSTIQFPRHRRKFLEPQERERSNCDGFHSQSRLTYWNSSLNHAPVGPSLQPYHTTPCRSLRSLDYYHSHHILTALTLCTIASSPVTKCDAVSLLFGRNAVVTETLYGDHSGRHISRRPRALKVRKTSQYFLPRRPGMTL
jgi:hypothetical protein